MKQTLKLNELKVQSFATEQITNTLSTVKGGAAKNPFFPSPVAIEPAWYGKSGYRATACFF